MFFSLNVLKLHLPFLLFIVVLNEHEYGALVEWRRRKPVVFREKCNRAMLSRSPREICGRHSDAGTDFPHQYYSTNGADQCSSTSGLGCRPNPKYSLTYWVTVPHLFFMCKFFYVAICKAIKYSCWILQVVFGVFWNNNSLYVWQVTENWTTFIFQKPYFKFPWP